MQFSEYLKAMLVPLLREKDHCKVVESIDQMGILLTVDIHPSDMGQVIGKAGETAKAIRTLARAFGGMHQARVSIKFIEPEGGRYYIKK